MEFQALMTGVVTPLLVCIIGGMITIQNNKRKTHDEKQERLQISMLSAIMATSRACLVLLHQAHGDKLNGNVEEAIDSVKASLDDMNDIVNTIAGGGK